MKLLCKKNTQEMTTVDDKRNRRNCHDHFHLFNFEPYECTTWSNKFNIIKLKLKKKRYDVIRCIFQESGDCEEQEERGQRKGD